MTAVRASARACRLSNPNFAEMVQRALGSIEARVLAFDEARDEFTRSYLTQLLQLTRGNVTQAARLARRNRTDFYKLLARHEVSPEGFKS